MGKKYETVYSVLDSRDVKAIRQSNQTLIVERPSGMVDSDKAMLEDTTGHRYSRNIPLEIGINYKHYIFEMI